MQYCTECNIIQPWERNSAIYNNIEATWEHYTNWVKSAGERQTSHDITYVWNKNLHLNKQKNAVGGGGMVIGEKLAKEYKCA